MSLTAKGCTAIAQITPVCIHWNSYWLPLILASNFPSKLEANGIFNLSCMLNQTSFKYKNWHVWWADMIWCFYTLCFSKQSFVWGFIPTLFLFACILLRVWSCSDRCVVSTVTIIGCWQQLCHFFRYLFSCLFIKTHSYLSAITKVLSYDYRGKLMYAGISGSRCTDTLQNFFRNFVVAGGSANTSLIWNDTPALTDQMM